MKLKNSTDLYEVLMGMDDQGQAKTPKHEWLNEKKVAILIGVSVYTLRQHRHKGIGLPYVKYGKSVRYSIIDIVDYLESRTINHKKD